MKNILGLFTCSILALSACSLIGNESPLVFKVDVAAGLEYKENYWKFLPKGLDKSNDENWVYLGAFHSDAVIGATYSNLSLQLNSSKGVVLSVSCKELLKLKYMLMKQLFLLGLENVAAQGKDTEVVTKITTLKSELRKLSGLFTAFYTYLPWYARKGILFAAVFGISYYVVNELW